MPCSDCDLVYFGETGREFGVRLREHKDAVRRGNNNNACFKHSFEGNHNIDWGNSGILFKSDNWYERLIVESAYISTKPNFNNMRSTLGIDNFSAKIVLNSLPKINSAPP